MRLLNRLKCSLTSRVCLRAYYQGLTTAELEVRKRMLHNQYAASGLAWIGASVMMFMFNSASVPVLILYGIAVMGTIVSLVEDYRRRKRLIEQILVERTEI